MPIDKKKVLVLGGGIEQLPLITKLKENNYFVILIDKKKNVIGKKYTDKFYNFSIKKYKKIFKISKKEKIKSIISICSDNAVLPCSKISNLMKLPGININSAKICTDKFLMKKNFKKKNINTPKFFSYKSSYKAKKKIVKLKLPIIIKPVDSYGQRGLFKLNDHKNLNTKILKSKKASGKNKIIIEEFIDGIEINIVAIVKDFKIKILSMSKRETYDNNNFGIAHSHSYPLDLKKNTKRKIKNLVLKAIRSTKISNGVLYPQVIYNNFTNKAYLIEIAARVPGGFMRELSMLASGIDPIDFQIYCSLGDKNFLKNKIKPKKSIYIRFLTKRNFPKLTSKIFKKSLVASKLKGIFKIHLNKIKKVPNLTDSTGRFGAIISFGYNINSAKRNCLKALNKLN